MAKYYTDEKNVQILIALLKEHGIKKVIASPGSANSPLVASLQYDPYFEMYSSVDERSAAYMACGLSSETGEPVVISCTGATASRNYLPGLTEAYYRKFPILAITSTRNPSKIGNLVDQVIDRSVIQKDVAKISVTLPIINSIEDIWECENKANKAILELTRHGGGPAHINLPTIYTGTYTTKNLPKVRKINRVAYKDELPKLPKGKIAIFIGSHKTINEDLCNVIDLFCECNNAVVLCDHTSKYKGKFGILFPVIVCQNNFLETLKPELLIHIGEISGFFAYLNGKILNEVWRVSEDGEIRDSFQKLRYVFDMTEEYFFTSYCQNKKNSINDYYFAWTEKYNEILSKIPQLPFSNIWIASKLSSLLPDNSTIHFGILNSLRSWNFFKLPKTVTSDSNVGGFGIDGILSSIVGSSLANKEKLFFCIMGDLAFFYDMNALGNRHIGNNLRLMIVNNGKGTEFKLFLHQNGTAQFDEETDEYMAASRHFGNKSKKLVKHYAEDLGFDYLSASDKQEFQTSFERFVDPHSNERSIVFEVFTDSNDENKALEMMCQIDVTTKGILKQMAKKLLR